LDPLTLNAIATIGYALAARRRHSCLGGPAGGDPQSPSDFAPDQVWPEGSPASEVSSNREWAF